jgi:hypothetical protein
MERHSREDHMTPPLLDRARAATLPTRPVLVEYAARQVAAAIVVAGAALVAHRAGLDTHVWPYVVMAGAIVPQVLLALAALGDEERRGRIRATSKPAPVPALLSLALALTAAGGLVADQPGVSVMATVIASVGLAVSALPTHLHIPRRRR